MSWKVALACVGRKKLRRALPTKVKVALVVAESWHRKLDPPQVPKAGKEASGGQSE